MLTCWMAFVQGAKGAFSSAGKSEKGFQRRLQLQCVLTNECDLIKGRMEESILGLGKPRAKVQWHRSLLPAWSTTGGSGQLIRRSRAD